jgi:GNAT superfamily N-acetyltransferase
VTVAIAHTDPAIAQCFSVMRQLRPHLSEAAFVPTVREQQRGGYVLVHLTQHDTVRAVAGYRIIDNLVGGRVLYVDDLVTDAACRSQGYGQALFDWLTTTARDAQCRFLELDSGVQRFDAHRFYLTNRMIISSHHFRLAL